MTENIHYLDNTYKDALGLLVEARNYIAYRQKKDEQDLPPRIRIQISLETMRLTTRLTQVMAWALAQRAAGNKELEWTKAISDEFGLDGKDVCHDNRGEENGDIPDALRSLLGRSRLLYLRVERLHSSAQERFHYEQQFAPQQK